MFKLRISLTTKFIILFLTISLIPLAIAIYVSYDSSKMVLEEETARYFYGIIDNKVNQIESYFSDRKEEAATLVKIPTVVESLERFNGIFQKMGAKSSEYKTLDKEIRPFLTYFQKASNYVDLMLVSPNGDLLFSVNNREKKAGTDIFAEDVNLKALFNKSKILLETEMSLFEYYPENQKLYAYIVTPVLKEEILIGFGIFRIDHEGIFDIIQDYTGLGESGETILALKNGNNKAIFITPIRHDPEAAFKREIILNSDEQTDVQKALQGQRGWGIATDYRGKEVLTVWRYLPVFQWGMVVKMDLVEVLEMVEGFKTTLSVISLILLIMIVLIALLMVHSVSGPVKKLTRVAADISRGNLSARAEINSGDEIEKLAQSFNQMTDSLLKTQENLKEKSKDLANNLENLSREKQKVVQAKERLDTVLYSIGDGVFVVDVDQKITIFNQEAEIISGFSANEVINKKYSRNLKFTTREGEKEKMNNRFIQEAVEEGEIKKISSKVFLISKSGKKIPISGSAAPLKDNFGKFIGCVIVFRDVTKEREIDRAKTEFVSLASHQLRTPLSAVNWYTEMLLNEDIGKINKKQKEYLNFLTQANNRMVELVNSLLNVSRIELGTFTIEPEPTNFTEVADSVIREQNQQIEGKEIRLTKDYGLNLPIVNADLKFLRVIFQNLLSNAVKYTPEKGSVTLSIKEEKNDILIKIQDTGYGIPQNQQSKIFTKLFRADNAREKDTDGNGLGLYIVKSIIEQAGGKIWFESKENKGTTFYVTIPLSGMKKKKGAEVLAG